MMFVVCPVLIELPPFSPVPPFGFPLPLVLHSTSSYRKAHASKDCCC